MRINPPSDKDGKFDLAPMVDVVFLLIVFFMAVAQMIQETNPEIEPPEAEKGVVPSDMTGRGTISVLEDGRILRDQRTELSLEEVTQLARRELERNPDFRIIIRADRNTPHRYVRDVMRACADGGAYDLVFSTVLPATGGP